MLAKSTAKADMSNFTGAALDFKLRPSSTSTVDLEYPDTTVELGKWNCYLVRSAYNQPPNFLTSDTPQQPSCVQPLYNPISFAGVAASGSEVCQIQDPNTPVACDPTARWGGTGNSRIRIKLGSVPQGDLDYYDVYLGSSPYAEELLFDSLGAARKPFQTILRGDALADTDPDDPYLAIGGPINTHILGGTYYFLVRARCLGCSFVDTNKNVSNAVVALRPWLVSSYNFKVANSGDSFASDKVVRPLGGNLGGVSP